jgi:PEP-CTERM motif
MRDGLVRPLEVKRGFSMRIMTSSAFALILSTGLVGAAHAAQSEIDLSSLTNANLQTYTDGTAYPTAGSTVTIGAASFLVSSDAGAAGTTGAIQVSSPSDSFVIPVNQAGYSTVYVLVNSAFGVLGETVGSLVFQDSAGDTDTISLQEGINIRDHWTAYNDVATDIYGTATYGGGVRFDAYEYVLPASFEGNTLTSITLSGAPDTNNPNGEPFLAAVTLATGASPVPEPSTWAMMMAGFAGLGWLGFTRRRAIGSAAA